ncbi:GNAT family N-acetyltransferase [Metabacillus malikii]|uniref:Spore maturation protein CgeE n=1 Tax=Metabacillus malikii TaxID=1504265 RepID=A0ABT9ZCY6_9BACI|nr:GNAT family N-acetyltransferase [Metabacillus malikii]MDQ0230128.1 spore maturation protein CgeE [Metabacillus malikii]
MLKTSLKNRLLEMEHAYVRLFSDTFEDDIAIKYIDSSLPNMYTHNFTFYKANKGLYELIVNEIEKIETKHNGFFRVETTYQVSNELLDRLPIKPHVCIYDIMYIKTQKYRELKGNRRCHVVKADHQKVLEDGITVDIEANQKDMGLEFARKRINRKADIYQNEAKPLHLYVCYDEGVPIGNIEYMQLNGIVKLEDFDIIEQYQRKGYGTAVLKHLVETAYNNGIDIAYLITNSADTAKEMYKKNQFTKIGEKTELLFFLNNND